LNMIDHKINLLTDNITDRYVYCLVEIRKSIRHLFLNRWNRAALDAAFDNNSKMCEELLQINQVHYGEKYYSANVIINLALGKYAETLKQSEKFIAFSFEKHNYFLNMWGLVARFACCLRYNRIDDVYTTLLDMKYLTTAYPTIVTAYTLFILAVSNFRVAIFKKNYENAVALIQQVMIGNESIIIQFCYPMFLFAEGVYELIMLTKAGAIDKSNLSILLNAMENIHYWFWMERSMFPHIEVQAWLWSGALWCAEGSLQKAEIALRKGSKCAREFELFHEEALMKAIIAPIIFSKEEATNYTKEAEEYFTQYNLQYDLQHYIYRDKLHQDPKNDQTSILIHLSYNLIVETIYDCN